MVGQLTVDMFKPHLLCDIRVHAIVVLPLLLSGINVEPCTSAKVPAVFLALNVAATWGIIANKEVKARRISMLAIEVRTLGFGQTQTIY